MTDEDYMKLAIELARLAERASKCTPIGCVLMLDGAVIAQAHNEVDHRCDPTAHAKIVAIRQARFSFLSVEGGLDDVREFLSGR